MPFRATTSGRTTGLGVLLVLLLVGTLGLIGIFLLANRDVHAPRGTELMCEDVGFKVLDVAAAPRVGAPPSEQSARGRYRIVRLEVVNHSLEDRYNLAWHLALLMDASGGIYRVDPAATEALRAAEGGTPVPTHIAPGERCVTPLVYDLPGDARDLTLRIAWEEAALLNLVDLVMHGDRRLLLDDPR